MRAPVCVCVFTAVFGGYESLNRQPPARRLTDRWLCFTYDPRLASDDWEIVVVEPDFLLDPQRSARQIKMLGHPLVREYERSLWIDNSVVLDQPPNVIVDEWLRSADLAFCVHSFRESVLDEFLAVLDDSLDDRSRVLEQLDHYARSMPEVLDARPLWAAVIARRWTPGVERTMETWWKHVLRYSRRDQLSLIAALETTGLAVERVEVDNHRSPWHQWPIIPDRDTAMRHVTTQDLPRPPMAELRVSQRRLAEAHNRIVELSSATAEIEEERRRLEEELQRSEEERRRLEEQLGVFAERFAEIEARAAQLDELHPVRALEAVDLRTRADSLAYERDSMSAAVDQLLLEWTDLRRQLDAIGASRSWRVARGLSRALRPARAARTRIR